MSADFRMATDFLRHHKVQRLRARLGADGVLAWLGLIGYTAANKPDGRLTGLTPEDIVAVAEWKGEQNLVATLLELRLLDRRGKLYTLHNWSKRQPWITSTEKRWQKARKAAAARWAKPKASTESRAIRDCGDDATSIATSNATGSAQSNAPILTLPNLTQPKKIGSVAIAPASGRFQEFWERFPKKTAKQDAQRAWVRLGPDPALADLIIVDVGKRWVGYEKTYIPQASKYLRGKRWEDEIISPPANGVGAPRPISPKLQMLRDYRQRALDGAQAAEGN